MSKYQSFNAMELALMNQGYTRKEAKELITIIFNIIKQALKEGKRVKTPLGILLTRRLKQVRVLLAAGYGKTKRIGVHPRKPIVVRMQALTSQDSTNRRVLNIDELYKYHWF